MERAFNLNFWKKSKKKLTKNKKPQFLYRKGAFKDFESKEISI